MESTKKFRRAFFLMFTILAVTSTACNPAVKPLPTQMPQAYVPTVEVVPTTSNVVATWTPVSIPQPTPTPMSSPDMTGFNEVTELFSTWHEAELEYTTTIDPFFDQVISGGNLSLEQLSTTEAVTEAVYNAYLALRDTDIFMSPTVAKLFNKYEQTARICTTSNIDFNLLILDFEQSTDNDIQEATASLEECFASYQNLASLIDDSGLEPFLTSPPSNSQQTVATGTSVTTANGTFSYPGGVGYIDGRDIEATPPLTIMRVNVWDSIGRLRRPTCQLSHGTQVEILDVMQDPDFDYTWYQFQIQSGSCKGWVTWWFVGTEKYNPTGELIYDN